MPVRIERAAVITTETLTNLRPTDRCEAHTCYYAIRTSSGSVFAPTVRPSELGQELAKTRRSICGFAGKAVQEW